MKPSAVVAIAVVLLARVGLCAVPNLLLFSRTVGYRHESIPVAAAAIQDIATSTSLFNLTWSEDETLFAPSTLAQYSIIAFLSNSDQVLTSSACLFNDTSFAVAIGALFSDHPTIGNTTFDRVLSHPTTDMLPSPYTKYEEAYRFRSDPRSVGATVLFSLNETSAPDAYYATSGYWQGSPAPSIWFRDGVTTPVDLNNVTSADESSSVMRGRMWYTSLGHTNETWQDPVHLAHVQAGIEWVIEGLSTNSTSSASSTVGGTSSSTPKTTSATVITTPSAAGVPSSSATSTSGAAAQRSIGGVVVALAATAVGLFVQA